MVAFSGDLDLAYLAPGPESPFYGHELLVDNHPPILYTKWRQRGRDIFPYGDWHLTPDKVARQEAKLKKEYENKSFVNKMKSKLADCILCLLDAFSGGCCRGKPSREEIGKYYGEVGIKGRKFDKKEHDEDMVIINHLTFLTEG